MLNSLRTLLLGTGVLLSCSLFASGIEFTSGSWEEITAKAQREDKLIFVDFYAEWCAPCKWMARETFTQKAVGDFFNQNFINVSIDAEKEFLQLVNSTGIDAYPTLAIFDANGLIIIKETGAKDASGILSFGRKAVGVEKFEAAFLANPNNSVALYEYASILKFRDEEKAKELVLEYLSGLTQNQWMEPDNWKLIKEFTNVDDDIFAYVRTNRTSFYEKHGREAAVYFFDNARLLLDRAVIKLDQSLIEESVKLEIEVRRLENSLTHEEGYYRLESYYIYYFHLGMHDRFAETYDQLVKKYLWDNEEQLMSSALQLNRFIINNSLDHKYYEYAMKWSDRGISLNAAGWRGYFSKAVIFYSLSKNKEALPFAQRALTNAPEEYKSDIKELVSAIENPPFQG